MKTTYWFIENVKKLMTDLNISQTKLAEKTGLSQGGISDLLLNDGRSPSLEVCEKISEALGYPVAALLVPNMSYPVIELPINTISKEKWYLNVLVSSIVPCLEGLERDPKKEINQYKPSKEDTQEDIEYHTNRLKSALRFKKEFEEIQRNYVKDLRRYS